MAWLARTMLFFIITFVAVLATSRHIRKESYFIILSLSHNFWSFLAVYVVGNARTNSKVVRYVGVCKCSIQVGKYVSLSLHFWLREPCFGVDST